MRCKYHFGAMKTTHLGATCGGCDHTHAGGPARVWPRASSAGISTGGMSSWGAAIFWMSMSTATLADIRAGMMTVSIKYYVLPEERKQMQEEAVNRAMISIDGPVGFYEH